MKILISKISLFIIGYEMSLEKRGKKINEEIIERKIMKK